MKCNRCMRISLKALARESGVSVATVSRALRDLACVDAETRRHVQETAARMGYVRDPLLASAFAFARRTDKPIYRETLAFLAIEPPMLTITASLEEKRPWMRGIWLGLSERAKTLGYQIESFRLPPKTKLQQTLARQLRARGIRGVVFGPRALTDACKVDTCWGSFATIEIGHTLDGGCGARVDRLLADDMERLLMQLYQREYRRIGLAMQDVDEARRHWAVFGACLLFERRSRLRSSASGGGRVRISSLFEDGIRYSPEGLIEWISRGKLDVIIGNGPEPLDWLLAARWNIPGQLGVCRIDCLDDRPESGLRIDYEKLGASAVNQLATVLERSEATDPDRQHHLEAGRPVLGIPSTWHEGETLRTRK